MPDLSHMREVAARALDRIATYPFTHAISAGMMVSAVTLLLALGDTRYAVAVAFIAISAYVSGSLIIAGLQWAGSRIISAGLERFGLYMAAGVWACDAILVGYLSSPLDSVAPALLLIASVIRARQLHHSSKARVERLHVVRKAVEGGDGET